MNNIRPLNTSYNPGQWIYVNDFPLCNPTSTTFAAQGGRIGVAGSLYYNNPSLLWANSAGKGGAVVQQLNMYPSLVEYFGLLVSVNFWNTNSVYFGLTDITTLNNNSIQFATESDSIYWKCIVYVGGVRTSYTTNVVVGNGTPGTLWRYLQAFRKPNSNDWEFYIDLKYQTTLTGPDDGSLVPYPPTPTYGNPLSLNIYATTDDNTKVWYLDRVEVGCCDLPRRRGDISR